MPTEEKDIERFLSVGNSIMFHTDSNRKDGPRYKTVIRGWRKLDHILLDRPKAPNGAFAALNEGQNCVMRFLAEGRACAFDSYVLNWDAIRQHPYMRIRWPKSVQYVNFRRFERLKLQVVCSVQWADSSSSQEEIRDLSIGGCGVQSAHVCSEGEVMLLTFSLPDGSHIEELKTQVCNVRPVGEQYLLGCRFVEGQEYVTNDIAFFVTSTLDRQRIFMAEERPAQRILIVDDNETVGARLKRGFEQRGYEALLAANVVDGMCRLRMSSPIAVLVSETMKDLAGLEICRIIRRVEDFQKTLLYLYGGQESWLADRAKEMGIDGYFPPVVTMAPDIILDVSQVLAKRFPKQADA